ncbi:MAG: hypothetical protein DRH15_14440, partial [Deltaproteobacteria bacterium]
CEICGQEKKLVKCTVCGVLFCDDCGDVGMELCEYCMEDQP